MPGTADIRTEDLHEAFLGLKAGAREIEPGGWWLNQSELTTLGYEAIVRDVAETLEQEGSSADPVLLDWGAGPAFTTYLLEHLGVSTVYYDFEHDFPSYRFVLDQLKGEKRFVDDPIRLPFADGTFDGALSCGVLEHVPDPSASLAEMYRVLKPGGLFFVYHFPNKFSYTEVLAGMIGQANHDLRWTRGQLMREMRGAGFEVVRFDYRYLIPRNLVRFPRLRKAISTHAQGVYGFDRALSRVPVLNVVSNALNCVVRKPHSAPDGFTSRAARRTLERSEW